MKRIIAALLLIICIVVTVFILFKGEKSPKDVLSSMGAKQSNIAHIEYTSNGAFVFIDNTPRGFSCWFMKKSILGWKYEYDLSQGGLTPFFTQCGFSFTKFPKVKSVPFSLYCGVISDPRIKAIKVEYKNGTQSSDADIIDNGSIRLWIAPMTDIDNGDVYITGLSTKGEEISRVRETNRDIQFEYYDNAK